MIIFLINEVLLILSDAFEFAKSVAIWLKIK